MYLLRMFRNSQLLILFMILLPIKQLITELIQLQSWKFLKYQLFYKINIFNQSMCEQRVALQNLFTFGHGQLLECISQQRKRKFPFLQNAKIKKTVLLHKLVSQQRQKIIVDNENNNPLNIPSTTKSKRRILSQDQRKVSFQLGKDSSQINSSRYNSNQNKSKKKISLPKVHKNVFPDLNNKCFFKRKITSAESSIRYAGQQQSVQLVQPFNLLELQKHQSCIKDKRPKSVMFLSQISYQIPESRIKTIQHHRNRAYSKYYKSKTDQKLRGSVIDNKIMENINQYKKIYC